MLFEIVVGFLAGLAATKVTEAAQQTLYRVTPERVKNREERIRPGPPFRIAARKAAERVGVDLQSKGLERAGMAVHYGSGLAWGPAYGFLRRFSGMTPLGAGLVTGATMSLILDEALTPAFGLSAPSRAYPAVTHIRGFVGHLVFGFAVAAAAEALFRLAPILSPTR